MLGLPLDHTSIAHDSGERRRQTALALHVHAHGHVDSEALPHQM